MVQPQANHGHLNGKQGRGAMSMSLEQQLVERQGQLGRLQAVSALSEPLSAI